jgi:hypothetical protein
MLSMTGSYSILKDEYHVGAALRYSNITILCLPDISKIFRRMKRSEGNMLLTRFSVIRDNFSKKTYKTQELLNQISSNTPEMMHLAHSACMRKEGTSLVVVNNKSYVLEIMLDILLTIHLLRQKEKDEVEQKRGNILMQRRANKEFLMPEQMLKEKLNVVDPKRWILPLWSTDIFHEEEKWKYYQDKEGGTYRDMKNIYFQ